MQAVSDNAHDGACFKLDKQNGGEKAMVQGRGFLKIYSLKFCENAENFKIEVELTNFLTHLIITEQLYY